MGEKYYLFEETGLILSKDVVDKATKDVKELRRKVDNGEIDLTKYENMLDEFEEKPEGCGKDTDCYGHPNINGGWKCGKQYLKQEIILCPKCKEDLSII